MARYIDADALYRRVKEKTNPYGKPTLDYESGVKVLNMIEQTPTADVVEVKHEEWIEKEGMYGDIYYTCSNCKNDWTTIDGTPSDNFVNYCPYCGAKMDGKDETDDA